MRARVGDLAIVRFDPSDECIEIGLKWDKKVCIVIGTGVRGPNDTRYCQIMYWDAAQHRCRVIRDDIPPHRLLRARPVNDYWNGNLSLLTLENVVSI